LSNDKLNAARRNGTRLKKSSTICYKKRSKLMEYYKQLMIDFMGGRLTTEDFVETYMNSFKVEEGMDDDLFDILNRVFESADSYSPECLPGQENQFEISEEMLREELKEALEKLPF
jgi:hypothetical protein